MSKVTANDIKTKGVGVLEDETIISVRGKDEFVVLSMEHYNRLRELELDYAIAQVEDDIKNGRYHLGTPEEHLKRISE
ncbi:type II toxin-antitoxin system prevent-host-death family antitoxin [Seleniivibrio sp.]|uniref:type II toxin-antitoxin system prevent-host-death family antitoxin n=1 Tax=Seleniivibrio sp. TaxID=2898801 RepID=UPI0025D6A3C5|nr:type II toxin-antitoxin system prevent-host-death family antitoxin [Seleniivibrio sp.]MCD8554920.1 type II toxin-antitoxin system prevent-host-death family antitoxin [Seleniivibrio sp.]